MARRRKKLEPIEQANRAVKVFRGLLPTLNAYARMLTGNPAIRVVAAEHSNGSTDGKVIYYRPPISLGENLPHERFYCDRRDEELVPLCPACAQREFVLRTIYHEIAHIWFKSFDALTDHAKDETIRLAVQEVNSAYGEKVAKRIKHFDKDLGYMGLARFISPFLPMILNALEDGRVNRELHKSLPGTKVMFASTTGRVFREGVEQMDTKTGEWCKKLWSSYPLNAQAVAGVLCMAQGYNFEKWLDPFVVDALNDDELHQLVMKIQDAGSMDTAFSLSFPVLARLRELGFCRSEEDPEEPDWKPPYSEPQESDDEGDGEQGSPEEDGDSSNQSSDGGDDSSGDQDDSDGDAAGSDSSDAGDDPSEDGDEVDGDADSSGGDDAGSDPSGSPEAGGETDSDAEGDDQDSGSAGSAGDSEVPEEASPGSGSEVSGREPDPAAGDSTDSGDGDGADADDVGGDASDSGVDGLPSPDRGNEGVDESGASGHDSGDDSGDGEDADVEPVDTGADEGGIRVEGEPRMRPDLDWGAPEEVEVVVMELGDHKVVHHDPHSTPDANDPNADAEDSAETEHAHLHRSEEDEAGDETVKKVLLHGNYFETPASGIATIKYMKEGDDSFEAQEYDKLDKRTRVTFGMEGDFDPAEAIIGPAVSRGRIVFSNEARTRHQIGLKRGRVHGASLARRAPFNDPKMFSQKRIPDSEDHFVGIGIDISGSTYGANLVLAKQVAMAEAEVLSRLGIPFFVMAHSGDYHWDDQSSDLTIREIKAPNEPWSDKTRNRLRRLAPSEVNLDGHTIEVYRGLLERQRQKVKILHYYTDGKMPAENHDEELEILQREIVTYRRKKLTLVGVGIRTDSPREHGLDTIEVHHQSDVIKVVEDLETRLTKH